MTGWVASGLQILTLVVLSESFSDRWVGCSLGIVQRPLGDFIAITLESKRDLRVESGFYRLLRIDAKADQKWSTYLISLLAFSLAGVLLLSLIVSTQQWPPFSLGHGPMSADQGFNTAASFVSNTNWQYSPADRAELLLATESVADELDDLLSNLLDLSRMQTGALVPVSKAVSVDEVVSRARIGRPPGRINDDISDNLPLIRTDAGLLERVIANLLSNALRHITSQVRVLAGAVGARMEIRAMDHGRECRRPTGRRCFGRSSGSATHPAARRSVWVWRWPVAWPRRSVRPSRSTTPLEVG